MSQTERKNFSRGLHRLFSTPSLMNGEDPEVYAELYARVEEVAQPKDVWDQMMVSDVVNHFWEQQRYRHSTGAIINSRRRPALESILSGGIGLNSQDAAEVADLYFGVARYEGDVRTSYSNPAVIPKRRPGVIALLEKHGFTESDIDRVAMASSVGTLTDLETLALKHELRREAILCELERRRERRARQLSATSSTLTKDLPKASSPPLIEPSS